MNSDMRGMTRDPLGNLDAYDWREAYKRATIDNERLRAELAEAERERDDLRRWKALDKPLTAAMAIVGDDMQRAVSRAERAEALLVSISTLQKADIESVECPHCHWGIHPNYIEQHMREKHSECSDGTNGQRRGPR